jgi:Mrp family chromosome partitioning ATPase/capsular polysaccharide biosynthesis protein/chorismate mutase
LSNFDPQALPGLGIKPLLSLRRHPRAALLVAMIVLLAGLPVAWIRGKSHFNSEAVFQVAPTYMKNMDADKELELQSNSQYREFVHHLSNTVLRQDVLERALESLKAEGIDLRPEGLSERKYIEQLRRKVYVRAIPDTYMVRIGTDEDKPEHLHDLINAVAASFVETTRTEQIFGTPERLESLRESVRVRSEEIADLTSQRVELAERLGLTTFSDSTVNPYDTTLAQARERAAAARVEQLRAQATLSSYLKYKELPASTGRSLLEMRLQDDGLQALRNEVVRRGEELSRQTAGLEDKHPTKQAAKVETDDMRQRMKSKELEFDRDAADSVQARLVASVAERAQVETGARAEVAGLEAQATEFARLFQQAMRLTDTIKKHDAELTRLRDRLNYLELESNAIGFVRIVSPALPAESPLGIGHKKMLMIVLLAAVLAGLATPLGLDLIDRRIRTVNDAEKLLGIPSAGWQVQRNGLATETLATEQTRRFAATLMRNRSRGGSALAAFTAVKQGAGVTSCVMDVAQMLRRLGQRVLVLEVNTMNPSKAFGDGPGLTDLLAGTHGRDGLARAQTWAGVQVDAIGIGSLAERGLERIDLLKQALAHWGSGYDHVLCDLPPVLLSADAEMLIELAGQVFLVVDADAVSRGEIARAKRVLQKLDPEAVGLYVNRIPMFQGAGYLQHLAVETVTRKRHSNVMTLPDWALGRELAHLKLTRWLHRRSDAGPGAAG